MAALSAVMVSGRALAQERELINTEIRLEWVDVPKGRNMMSGNLIVQIAAPNKLMAKSKTGGFGGSNWNR